MSTKKLPKSNRAARKAAKAVDVKLTKPADHHWKNGAKATFRKMVSYWTSLAVTSVTFAGMLALTLVFDKYVFHTLFVDYAAGADEWLVLMFKGAKYLAVFVELVFWVYGLYKDCKHHSADH